MMDAPNFTFVERPQPELSPKVAQELDRIMADPPLSSLAPDELNLLMDYRLARAAGKTITGVFHWKVRK